MAKRYMPVGAGLTHSKAGNIGVGPSTSIPLPLLRRPGREPGKQNMARHQPHNAIMARRSAFDARAFRQEIEESLSKEEITYLIDIGLCKGNNTETIIKHLKFEEVKKFKDVAGRIGLLKQESVKRPSLSRICQAFPEITCELLLQSPNKGPVSLEACVKASGFKEFPTIARHQACSTLIPEDFNFRAEALEVIILPNMLFSERIQNDEWRNMSVREKFSYNFNYLDKSFHSDVVKEDDRWELARKYGILTENNDMSDVWVAAAEAAGKYLRDNYKCGLETSGTTSVDIVKTK